MKRLIPAIMAIFAISLIAFTGAASAYIGNPSLMGSNYNEDVHDQLQDAIEKGDYEAWVKIREDNNLPMKGKIFQKINSENFYLYQGLHNAVQNGDTEKASQIREELGLGMGNMFKNRGNGQGKGTCNGECENQGTGLGQNKGWKV